MEIERKSPKVATKNAMVKAEAAAGAAGAAVAVIRHDRVPDHVAADHHHALPRKMISRYRRRKTVSRKSVTTVRTRILRTRNQIVADALQPGRIAVGEIDDHAREADVMGHEAGKTDHVLDIVRDLATDLDQGIGRVLQNAGLDHLAEGEDEAIAANIVAVELVAAVGIPVEMTAVPIGAVRPSVAEEAAVEVGVTVQAASHHSLDAAKALHPVSTTTETVALQESAKTTNGGDQTNNRFLQGHRWVRQLLGSMIEELTIVDLLLIIATVIVIGTLAVSNQMLDEDQATVIIGMMIEKDR